MTSVEATRAVGRQRATRTTRGLRARRLTRRLAAYLPRTTDLAVALATSRDTVRAWRSGRGPERPRVALLLRVTMLVRLCDAADRYIADKRASGRWLLSSQPRLLGGLSPAQVVDRFGATGMNLILDAMPYLVPARPASPLDSLTVEDVRATLEVFLREQGLAPSEALTAPAPSNQELEAELAAWDAGLMDDLGDDFEDSTQNVRSPTQAPLIHEGAAVGV